MVSSMSIVTGEKREKREREQRETEIDDKGSVGEAMNAK